MQKVSRTARKSFWNINAKGSEFVTVATTLGYIHTTKSNDNVSQESGQWKLQHYGQFTLRVAQRSVLALIQCRPLGS